MLVRLDRKMKMEESSVEEEGEGISRRPATTDLEDPFLDSSGNEQSR